MKIFIKPLAIITAIFLCTYGIANAGVFLFEGDLIELGEQNLGARSVLSVKQGGTGASTFTSGECLVGNGTGAITTLPCGSGGGGGGGIFSTTTLKAYVNTYDAYIFGGTATTSDVLFEIIGGSQFDNANFDGAVTMDTTLSVTGDTTLVNASTTLLTATNIWSDLVGTVTGDLVCTDCLNATEIEDIYILSAGDAMTGKLIMTNASSTGLTSTNGWFTNLNSNVLVGDMGIWQPVSNNAYYPEETILTDFSTASTSGGNWVKGSAGTQIGDDTDYIKSDRSLKMTTDGDSVRMQSRYSPFADSATIDISGKHLKAWLKVDRPDCLQSNSGVKVWLTSDNFSGYSYYELAVTTQGDRYVKPNNWTQVTWYQGAMSESGTVDYSAINGMQITVEDDTTCAVTAWVGGVSAFDEANGGIVTFTFDDGNESQYTEARKKLSEYGYPATAYVPYGSPGLNGYMTVDQLTDLQNFNGWDISGHGSTNLTTLSTSSVETELLTEKNWLLKNGFQKGSDHYALPNGAYDEHTVLPLVKKYFKSNRTIFVGLDEETLPINDPYKLRPVYITNVTATSSVYAQIDNCYDNNLWCILTFHKIVPLEDVDTSTEYSISDFAYIVDYVNTKGIKVKTVSEVINSFSGEIDTATALASNGANCAAGSYPLGVDASGAVEDCTDATTEINSIVSGYLPLTGGTVTGQINIDDGSGDSPMIGFLNESNVAASLAMTESGNIFRILSDGTIIFRMNEDYDDYITMATTDDVPVIGTAGGANLKITADSGTIDFDDDNLTTSGTLGSGAITSTGDMSITGDITASATSTANVFTPGSDCYIKVSTSTTGIEIGCY